MQTKVVFIRTTEWQRRKKNESQENKREEQPNNKTGNDMAIDIATGYLAGCLQYSQTDQNSICSLTIFFLSKRDLSITRGKANKDMADTIESLSPFPAASVTYKTYSVFWPQV